MQNDITQYHSLPLPHPTNALQDDVLRLRDALSAIDSRFHALDTLLASNDVSLDQVQELVDAIKRNSSDITQMLASKADKAETTTALGTKANTVDVDSALALKADKSYVDAQDAMLAQSVSDEAAARASDVSGLQGQMAGVLAVSAGLNSKMYFNFGG